MRGRQTRRLTPDQIQRLEKFRRASHEGAPHGYSVALLRTAMSAKFSAKTMQKALQGAPVWVLYHSYIVEWIDRYLPVGPAIRDGKALAAGNGEGEDVEESDAARTVRGSR